MTMLSAACSVYTISYYCILCCLLLREGCDIAQVCVYCLYTMVWAMPRLYSRVALQLPSLHPRGVLIKEIS